MDRDTAVSRIQEKLGFRTDLVASIQNALQDAQDELEEKASLPWFLLQEDQTFTITPANPVTAAPQEYTLPTGFIKEGDSQDGGEPRWQQTVPGATQFVQRMDFKEAENYFFGNRKSRWQDDVEIIEQEDTNFTPGAPLVYVVRKNTVRIYPGPDIIYNLVWSYYTHDTSLTGGNTTNQWLTYAPWLLIGEAGIAIAGSARDTEAHQYFTERRDQARTAFLARSIERERDGRAYAMGARL